MGNDGKQSYRTMFYNLDAILSVGYRVNSRNATLFRRWATQVLKAYLLKGYAINARLNQLNDLELAIESEFDLAFGAGCWSFHPTEKEFGRFCETIKAIVEGRGATVRFCVGDEAKACAVLVGDELDAINDFALMERIAEKDWYGTDQDTLWGDPFTLSVKLKKELRRLRSRNGRRADYEYFNPANNKSLDFGKIST